MHVTNLDAHPLQLLTHEPRALPAGCCLQDDDDAKKHDLQRALVQKKGVWYKDKYW